MAILVVVHTWTNKGSCRLEKDGYAILFSACVEGITLLQWPCRRKKKHTTEPRVLSGVCSILTGNIDYIIIVLGIANARRWSTEV
jgi:hypothetical protein